MVKTCVSKLNLLVESSETGTITHYWWKGVQASGLLASPSPSLNPESSTFLVSQSTSFCRQNEGCLISSEPSLEYQFPSLTKFLFTHIGTSSGVADKSLL